MSSPVELRDESFLLRCGQLAALADGRVGDSPRVGAVLVFRGRIIGEGYHKVAGEAHAEVNCLASVREDDRPKIPDSTLYVSLEPCCIQGRSGACTDLIQRHGIKRVVFAQRDATPGVNGMSVGILEEANVSVTEYNGFKPTLAPNRFRKVIASQERPFVLLKFAQSADGFLRPENREEDYWLTNPISRRLVHRWRANSTAIMVGGRTIVEDNPGLNTRLFPGPSPRVIVLDPKDRCTGREKIFRQDRKPVVFSGSDRPDLKAEVVPLSSGWKGALPQVLSWLHAARLGHLTVEGGAALLQAFIQQGLWDEARVFTSPQQLNAGLAAPALKGEVRLLREEKIGTDLLRVFARIGG
ncbi:bifunctional diaminohydroxyphosphoribosylaminopyrimidine deaminase/5-amino-6-(5-phosphoribosylamino)uracil reductase RibD [Lewinella sp. W8]|uniref:bifunctional diaminohydroxyphosphoribosylaminopyrimidine deaminase/5-amino-6-(5-phosphoribosylamino)uracil reductase RibD n=1 Tax=Lewinella sp. W8 TaxID=2528208 RepID=UPI001067A254|nr:bifunctional diaminohydroxyphosphoribosylaminopyrimidine deaminase/5-amino-6-(5-phosphoribosylamino)uracil reductase RibD [Lewinella sp. W8]MTB49841.1 bifunctional diaminohydroxyphosphoribosylaminopyrimidine deaminase/5-amino-6-(5-phosphoribosylamino)uracil reductase RibD [Lewinella sp. W8]